MKNKSYYRNLNSQKTLKQRILYALLTFALLGFSVCSYAFEPVFEQSYLIKISCTDMKICDVLDQIQAQSGVKIVYSNDDLQAEKKVSVQIQTKNLEFALASVLGDTYTFNQVDDYIAIVRKSQAKSSVEANATQQNTKKRVKGKVVDVSNEAIVGATVVIKGTSIGVATDVDGNFNLEVPENAVLKISYIGFESIEVKAKVNNLIVLQEDDQQLEEVVVTALGLTKEKKALGYSVQQVESATLNRVASTDLASKLSGQVAGLQVNTSSTIGGSSRIVLRGESNLGLDGNDALIVVNGVPIRNGSSFAGGIDWGNAMGDISSNDVESISVLKGATAAALYGSRAANGVILITTKKGSGKKGLTVSYNGSVMFESLLAYPDQYQYKYGPGRNDKQGANNDPWFRSLHNADGTANLKNPYDSAWSMNEYDPNKMVEFWWSPTSNGFRAGDDQILNKGTVAKSPFVSTGKNNYEEFYETGVTYFNSVAVSGSSDNVQGRISFENMNQTGMSPGTDLERNTVSSNLTFMSDKVTVNSSLNYVNTSSDNRPNDSWSTDGIGFLLACMSPGMHIQEMKQYWQSGLEGLATVNWNPSYKNPYYVSHEQKNSLHQDRIYGNFNINYKPITDLNIMLRHGEDITYRQTGFEKPWLDDTGAKPNISRERTRDREANTDVLVTYTRTFNDKTWNFDANIGANRMITRYEMLKGSNSALLIPGIPALANTDGEVPNGVGENWSKTETRSVYGFANVDYKNMIYLSVTGRNDWSSTLPTANNSYFYPSATLSLLVHEMVALPEAITFLKVRGAMAQVASTAGAYQLNNTMGGGTYLDWTVYNVGNTLNNIDLKPQMSVSSEIGVTARFLNNRIGIDASIYTTTTTDQIMPITYPVSSGYVKRWTNAGEIRNQGLELILNVRPIQTRDFDWDLTANFSTNNSEVIELAEGLDRYQLTGSDFGDVSSKIMAEVGREVMGIFARKQATVKDESSPFYGQKINNKNGVPVRDDSEYVYIGKAGPDWILGLTNNFRYKNFNLGAVFDIRQGGMLYSMATNKMIGTGSAKITQEWRDNGVLSEGVIDNGDGTYRENDIVLKGHDIKDKYVSSYRKMAENNFFSSSFVKLRELSLSYNLPVQLLQKTPFSKAAVSLVGRNLLVWDDVPNQDPDVYRLGIPGYSGTFAIPSSRTYGVSLNVEF